MANKFEKIINSFQFDKPSKKQVALFLKAAKRQIVDLVKTKIKEIKKTAFLREKFGFQKYGAGVRKYNFNRVSCMLSQTPKIKNVLGEHGDLSFYENNTLAEGLTVRIRRFGGNHNNFFYLKFSKSEILSIGTYGTDWIIYKKLNHVTIKDFCEAYRGYWWWQYLLNFGKLNEAIRKRISHENYRNYFLTL